MVIKDCLAISPQDTYNNEHYLNDIKYHFGNKVLAVEPDYSGIIKASQLRRMGKALRMGIGCGFPLFQKNSDIDGIIIGTSEGGLEDCIKFLNQIVDYEEGTLTPTNFVQSTPNAIGGLLALMTKNHKYNITHVNKGLSFENAVLDAKMLLSEKNAKKLLVGNIEEVSEYNFNIDKSAGHFKKHECSARDLIKSNSQGTVCGEGAAMFIFTPEGKKNDVAVMDIDTITFPETNDIIDIAKNIIHKNNLKSNEIDAVIAGYSGDVKTDNYYDNIIENLFSEQTIISYKHLIGEYPTSTAFALKLAYDIMTGKNVPEDIILKQKNKTFNNIIIYNHYRGIQHSFILLGRH